MTVRPAVWLAAAVVVAADLATKQWALAALEPGEVQNLLGDALGLQLVFNGGAALSLGKNHTWVLTIVAAAVTAGILYYARKAQTRLAVLLVGIALGGAVGNLLDRLFREPGFGQGHVVDMIKYGDWFVGNVADIAIVGAAAVFVAASLVGRSWLTPAAGTAEGSAPVDGATPDDGAAPVDASTTDRT